ncbi:hypothetical protein [Actinophytocola sp.]|uniref:hypothetical protein n=1 Tax=Actinophytocola sp. TaxID=1872138 RepID=UPI003D6C508B
MLDAGGGGGAGIGAAAKIMGIAAAAGKFAVAAAEGHFAINESGGRALLEAIREMRDWINGQDAKLTHLAQVPPLGGSHGAQTLKPYVQNVATDQQGFITMLKEFARSLDQAEQGIKDAMGNYKNMDTELAKRYKA